MSKLIARVFPTKTSMCPTDEHAYFGDPNLFTPHYDEVHISVTFTWDIQKAQRLQRAWDPYGIVKMDGVAINGESNQPMIEGMYLRKGITITSRGCPYGCWFCEVAGKKLIEFNHFPRGNIIQDNNILACTETHLLKVFDMLKTEKQIEFKGGLDKRLLNKDIALELKKLKIKSLWLSCDDSSQIKKLSKAIEILQSVGFRQNQIYCYVLCGFNMLEEEKRMREIFSIGAIPFCQLYRDKNNSIEYSKDWKHFQRTWSRPAAIKATMKRR